MTTPYKGACALWESEQAKRRARDHYVTPSIESFEDYCLWHGRMRTEISAKTEDMEETDLNQLFEELARGTN